MANNIVCSVHCPICGHYLTGLGTLENDALKITAHCPLCNNEYTFKENKTVQNTESGVTDG